MSAFRQICLFLAIWLLAAPTSSSDECNISLLPQEWLTTDRYAGGHRLLKMVAATSEDEPPLTLRANPANSHRSWGGDPTKFFQGAFVGFLGHECGHLLTNLALGTHCDLKGVAFGGIPFFTIEPGRELSPREHYLTASAGFNAQHIINEWLLVKHPNLHDENEPFLKGLATFNFWLTIGYAATAFAGYGPDERDTKGMADGLGWSEDSMGMLILTPTLLDAYRYHHPEAKWAKHASRISKIFILGLALEADG